MSALTVQSLTLRISVDVSQSANFILGTHAYGYRSPMRRVLDKVYCEQRLHNPAFCLVVSERNVLCERPLNSVRFADYNNTAFLARRVARSRCG